VVRHRYPLTALAGVLVLALPGCTLTDDGSATSSGETPEPLSLVSNVQDGSSAVAVDTVVSVAIEHGSLEEASLVADDDTAIGGTVAGGRWIAAERLEPGTSYTMTASGVGDDGEAMSVSSSFSTVDLSLDQQTYPSVAPLADETVGVGMPIIVMFDLPVENKALYERSMHVSAEPSVEGSWYWLSDREAHFRPKQYWPAGTEVHVRLDLNSLPAGNGVFGQQDQDIRFKVGREVISTVDVAAHTMTVAIDGRKVRTMPVTTGKAGNETREGTKVVMERLSSVDMDAATTGIDEDDPDYYNLSDVRWAMRLTNSGEFVHAAPWSQASQGLANVSHGCTGLSMADAKWLFDQSKRGDVMKFVNSPRSLEDHNGWTDWNLSWDDWQDGSSLP